MLEKMATAMCVYEGDYAALAVQTSTEQTEKRAMNNCLVIRLLHKTNGCIISS